MFHIHIAHSYSTYTSPRYLLMKNKSTHPQKDLPKIISRICTVTLSIYHLFGRVPESLLWVCLGRHLWTGKPWELWTNEHFTPLMDSKDDGIIWKCEKIGGGTQLKDTGHCIPGIFLYFSFLCFLLTKKSMMFWFTMGPEPWSWETMNWTHRNQESKWPFPLSFLLDIWS